MSGAKKLYANGSVVSTEAREGQDVFVQYRAPSGQVISSMDRKVYERALESAKASLRKKASIVGA